MINLNLSADEVLKTTRAVRRRLDFTRPVQLSTIKECLEIALQAPMGGNAARIRFVVVTDEGKRQALADLYQQFYRSYRSAPAKAHADDPGRERLWTSTDYLAEHFHEVLT